MKVKERGEIRKDQVGVFDNVTLRPVYMAVEPEFVSRELTLLFKDIEVLWDHRPDYYKNIDIGYNYYVLHWERCIPFLMMLPMALKGR